MPRSESLQTNSAVSEDQATTHTSSPLAAIVDAISREPEDAIFHDWDDVNPDVSLYDRVLMSIIAIAYAQANPSSDLASYTKSLHPEMQEAFRDRAARILSQYEEQMRVSVRQDQIETTWVDAAKYGLRAHLDDFSNAQIQSFQSLDALVRDRTSVKTQVIVAFGVALALAVFVGFVRPAVTIWDDIRHAIWSDNKG